MEVSVLILLMTSSYCSSCGYVLRKELTGNMACICLDMSMRSMKQGGGAWGMHVDHEAAL